MLVRQQAFKSWHVFFSLKTKNVNSSDTAKPHFLEMTGGPILTIQRTPDVDTFRLVLKGVDAVASGNLLFIPIFEMAPLVLHSDALASFRMPLSLIIVLPKYVLCVLLPKHLMLYHGL